MLKGPDTEINLQVLSSGCAEIDRIVMFRDWLRKMSLAQCPASTTFSGQRQLFFPIDDNYKLYECLILG
jgi:hypothetical protein